MGFIGTAANRELSAATDGELFGLMAQRGSAAKKAWAELYCRYVNELFRSVHRLSGLTGTDVQSLVQDTMVKAWNSAHTFDADDTLEPATSHDRTLSWLGRIAQNLYRTMRRQKKISLVSGSAEAADEDESSRAATGRSPIRRGELNQEIRTAQAQVEGTAKAEVESKHVRLLRQALATLTHREWDILITTFEYRERGTKGQLPLPQAVIDELCRAHSINPTYLRKIRERAYKKVVEFSKSHVRD